MDSNCELEIGRERTVGGGHKTGLCGGNSSETLIGPTDLYK